MSTEQYQFQVEVHNLGGFFFLRSSLQMMLEQDLKKLTGARYPSRGAIVLLTSLASEGAFKGVGNYTAAKFAVKGLVQTAGKKALLNCIKDFTNVRFSAGKRQKRNPRECCCTFICFWGDDGYLP